MEPLATYSERFLEVRRRFALYPDRVVVEARWRWRGRFETTVPLGTLRPEVRYVTVRYRLHRYAGWALALSLLGLAAAVYRPGGTVLTTGLAILGGAVAAGSAAVLLLTHRIRRTVFARFDPRAGRGGLDIGIAGNDAATFEAFVGQVRRQIARS